MSLSLRGIKFTAGYSYYTKIGYIDTILCLNVGFIAKPIVGEFNNYMIFQSSVPDNLFINYLSRIHRDEDFDFVLTGVTRLLNNPLVQTYLPNSTKKVHFHQELLVFFGKCAIIIRNFYILY